MRIPFFILLSSLPLVASSAPKKSTTPVAAVRAIPARPATPSERTATPTALINSDVGGRDMEFLKDAIDLGKALRYLAAQSARTSNSAISRFANDLARTLTGQSAVLNTLAEMKQIKVSDTRSGTEDALSGRITNLEGAMLEKAILDGFLTTNRHIVRACQTGAQSEDATIRKFAEETLLTAQKQLVAIENMAGVAQVRTAGIAAKPPTATEVTIPDSTKSPEFKGKPSFRTNIKLPTDGPAQQPR